MQFRIGMFVIVAGLVLTMLIVWFGESPSLLRDQVYLRIRYDQAPGVVEGVPVRKSGIRIGEVSAIAFDERPERPDGVIVTVTLERKFTLREGSVPRLNRSLIGDVTIDMQPGTGEGALKVGDSPTNAPIIEGETAPDPSKALAAATSAFEEAGSTLKVIQEAASGLSRISKSAEDLDQFIATWRQTGQDVSGAAQNISRVIKNNEEHLQPALQSVRDVAQKLDSALDPQTQDAFKTGIARLSSASARLDAGLTEVGPLLKDLGAPVSRQPATDFGQAVRRVNRIASDVELLTQTLRNEQGGLNDAGTIQKLLTQTELHDNLIRLASSADQVLSQLKIVLAAFRRFADKVSQDPSAISRGILRQ
jgi:phospholipid/cholesterol/gamma-HCH transport system substrate-binding protein